MTDLPRATLHHVALTVTDLDASLRWYQEVFDLKLRLEVPHAGGVGMILADDAWQLMIALHHHDDSDGASFRETRTGLDHVSFQVPSRAGLTAWQEHLAQHGVSRAAQADRPLTQSPIADEPYGSVLVFRDPDNIQIELYAPLPHL